MKLNNVARDRSWPAACRALWRAQARAVTTVLVAGLTLTACVGSGSAGGPDAPVGLRYHSARYDVALIHSARIPARQGFESTYFMSAQWNPDAPTDTPGQGLLTLTLPGSDKRLTASLRLGASDDTRAMACALPSDGNVGAVSRETLGGVSFRRRDTGDAAMNHFLQRHAYRAVAGGHCYAIDLIVDGTRAAVYSDGRGPSPMTVDQAFQRLHSLLTGLSFEIGTRRPKG